MSPPQIRGFQKYGAPFPERKKSLSKYLDKIKETASELQKIIKSFAGKNGVPRKTKEYGLANVKSTYDEQTKTNPLLRGQTKCGGEL